MSQKQPSQPPVGSRPAPPPPPPLPKLPPVPAPPPMRIIVEGVTVSRSPDNVEGRVNAALESEHANSLNNYGAILRSVAVGCFHCLRVMRPSDVREWLQDKSGRTAACPFCGIDSLIPNMELKTAGLLLELQREYFGKHDGGVRLERDDLLAALKALVEECARLEDELGSEHSGLVSSQELADSRALIARIEGKAA